MKKEWRFALGVVVIALTATGGFSIYHVAEQGGILAALGYSYETEIYHVDMRRSYHEPDAPVLAAVEGFTIPDIVTCVTDYVFPPFPENGSRLIKGPPRTIVTNITYMANVTAQAPGYTKNVTQAWLYDTYDSYDHYYLDTLGWVEYEGNGSVVIPIAWTVMVRCTIATNRSGSDRWEFFFPWFSLDTNMNVVLIIVEDPFPAFKPAIYLYPQETTDVTVSLDIRGSMFYSDPPYPAGGWHVTADPDGRIDDKYDYLYYDVLLDNVEVAPEGWIITGQQFGDWCCTTLPALGLVPSETSEFTIFWSTRLPDSDYLRISLLSDAFLQDNLALTVTPMPDVVIRCIFVFLAIDQATPIDAPAIEAPARSRFTVVEWGGIVLS